MIKFLKNLFSRLSTSSDYDIIQSIADRYVETLTSAGLSSNRAMLVGRLITLHYGTHSLDLVKLLYSSEGEFMRDTTGFLRNYDPREDVFVNGFMPYCLK